MQLLRFHKQMKLNCLFGIHKAKKAEVATFRLLKHLNIPKMWDILLKKLTFIDIFQNLSFYKFLCWMSSKEIVLKLKWKIPEQFVKLIKRSIFPLLLK